MGATGIIIGNAQPIPIAGGIKQQNYADSVKNLNQEQFVMFDNNGVPVKAFQGDRHSVSVDESTMQIAGDAIHNHPDKGWGGTLSMTDIKTFAKSKMNSLMAVDKQGNTYTIRDNGNGDRAGLAKWTNSQGKLLNKNFKNSYSRQVKNLTTPLKSGPHKGMVKVQVQKRVDGKLTTKTTYRQPMKPEQVDKLARQISTGMYARAYSKAIGKYGFSYVKGKTSGLGHS